ncbi:MAG: hypothetical protein AVDCRST_MAG54-2156, partial [uncultured Actinomycetospora sp.]
MPCSPRVAVTRTTRSPRSRASSSRPEDTNVSSSGWAQIPSRVLVAAGRATGTAAVTAGWWWLAVRCMT